MTGGLLKTAVTLAVPLPVALLVTVTTKLELVARPSTSLTVRVSWQGPSACGAVHVALDCEGWVASVPGTVLTSDMVPHAVAGSQLKASVAVCPGSGSCAVAVIATLPPGRIELAERVMPSMIGLNW